ncbi:MAG: hypothetical protein AAF748_05825 [Pseudomonadota bacterium]
MRKHFAKKGVGGLSLAQFDPHLARIDINSRDRGAVVLWKLPMSRRSLQRPTLGITETGWGYLLRSPHPARALPPGWQNYAWACSISIMAGIWLAFGGWPTWGAALSLTMLATTHFSLRWLTSVQTFEVLVDGRRREIRLGRVMPSGGTWFGLCAGFEEVADIRIRGEASGDHSLWISIRGEASLPFARGPEDDLLAMHDRLVADIRSRAAPPPEQDSADEEARTRRPFPPLTPGSMG